MSDILRMMKTDASHSKSDWLDRLDGINRQRTGGKINLKTGEYDISNTLSITSPCTFLQGEVWSYNSDPNGVFESKCGSRIKLTGEGYPAIEIGDGRTAEGCQIFNLGIQADLPGMDTRSRFSFANPQKNAGICFAKSRVDQAEFRKLSFFGMGVGICAREQAELDACRFTDLNLDGCAVGIYYSPSASYYSAIHRCVIADTPYSGLYIDGTEKRMHSCEVIGTHFVRNAGAFDDKNAVGYPTDLPFSSVCYRNVSNCLFRDNLIDYAGTYWHYDDNATSNSERQIHKRESVGLFVLGDSNRIVGNAVRHSSCASIQIRGRGNILLSDTVDGNVILEGNGNIVRDLIFVKPDAKLIVHGDALDTEQSNVPESRIVKV